MGDDAPEPTPMVTFSVMAAVAVLVESATLVAVTVTFWLAVMDEGAVYKPVESMFPAPAGLSDQVTAVLLVLVTVAVNCWVSSAVKVADVGETDTAITAGGVRVIFAVPVTLESAELVAVTVTVADAVTDEGAA
jgi:hypothetical protein